MMRTYFHQPCPGCGLTRSFIYFAGGDWPSSLGTHRLGVLLALIVVAQFPYRWAVLQRPTLAAPASVSRGFGFLIVIGLIGNRIVNVVNGYQP